MNHDDGLSDVGLDNSRRSFNHLADRHDGEASKKVTQNFAKSV
jgi:hypothetical protein